MKNTFRFLLVSGCCVSAICWSEPAIASGLVAKASISEAGIWDSNPMMRTQDEETIYGSVTSLAAAVGRETEASALMFNGSVDQNLFDDSDYNSTDYHTNLKASGKTQRFDASLKGTFDYDTTRTSEVTDLDVGTRMVRRTAYGAAPQLGYLLSPVSKIELTGGYNKSMYEGDSHTDYHTYSVSPSYIRNFTETYAGVLSARARRYESDEGVSNRVDSAGPSIGIIGHLSEKTKFNASVGSEASRHEEAGVVTQDWEWSYVFAGGFSFKGERDELSLKASREQQSSSSGSDDLMTTISAKEIYRVNPVLSLNVGASYQYADRADETVGDMDDMYTGETGLSYRVMEFLDVTASYRYRNKSFTGSDDVAQQSLARIGLVFRQNLVGNE